jgi:hypothetical protein
MKGTYRWESDIKIGTPTHTQFRRAPERLFIKENNNRRKDKKRIMTKNKKKNEQNITTTVSYELIQSMQNDGPTTSKPFERLIYQKEKLYK